MILDCGSNGDCEQPTDGSPGIYDSYDKMKEIINRDGWICGLGHGINKKTPEKNVHIFIENIRKNFS